MVEITLNYEKPLTPIPFTAEVLVQAYSQGFFPMPHPDTNEIMWFHPDPRAVFPLDGFHCSRSFKRTLNRKTFEVSFNKDFKKTMEGCADRPDSWINEQFMDVYGELHELGYAHSVEVWSESKMVGGLYGVSINGGFFAESMFHYKTDASKFAIYHLIKHMNERSMALLEVQFITDHLQSLGAITISREKYLNKLESALALKTSFGSV